MNNITKIITILIIISLAICFASSAMAGEDNIPLNQNIKEYTEYKCEKFNLDYEMILAVMFVESRFDRNAISYNGSSYGLMQLNKNTYFWIAQKGLNNYNFNPFSPYQNINAGVWYLDYLRDYWINQGYSQEVVFNLTLISYHRGIQGCKDYVAQYGYYSDYVGAVYNYKTKLER